MGYLVLVFPARRLPPAEPTLSQAIHHLVGLAVTCVAVSLLFGLAAAVAQGAIFVSWVLGGALRSWAFCSCRRLHIRWVTQRILEGASCRIMAVRSIWRLVVKSEARSVMRGAGFEMTTSAE